MTKTYDRGGFVDGHEVTIIALANGTFTIRRGYDDDDKMGFSSAADMVRFLESEYGANGADYLAPMVNGVKKLAEAVAPVPVGYTLQYPDGSLNYYIYRTRSEASLTRPDGCRVVPIAIIEKDETE